MKIQKIILLNDAIRQLVFIDKEKQIKLSGATRMKLAANLRVLSNHVQDYQENRLKMFKELGTLVEGKEDSWEVKKDSANHAQFLKEIDEMNALDREVKLETLTENNLFGTSADVEKQNQIPIDILSTFQEYGLIKE